MERIDCKFIEKIFDKGLKKNSALIHEVLRFNSENVSILAENERAFPGNKEFIQSGYYKVMLKRYLFSGFYFTKRKKVLDTCCGLGWGTYIVSNFAKEVVAFDIDPLVIDFCSKTWVKNNIQWLNGTALDLSFLGDEKFDVVLGMETIEHFSKEDGEKYICAISGVLEEKGIFIGTSAFPETEEEAEKLCISNQYHLHIFTYNEISSILQKYFTKFHIINQWMYIAIK